jgi:hypothetical protein
MDQLGAGIFGFIAVFAGFAANNMAQNGALGLSVLFSGAAGAAAGVIVGYVVHLLEALPCLP